jgi:hypothetical protein
MSYEKFELDLEKSLSPEIVSIYKNIMLKMFPDRPIQLWETGIKDDY